MFGPSPVLLKSVVEVAENIFVVIRCFLVLQRDGIFAAFGVEVTYSHAFDRLIAVDAGFRRAVVNSHLWLKSCLLCPCFTSFAEGSFFAHIEATKRPIIVIETCCVVVVQQNP